MSVVNRYLRRLAAAVLAAAALLALGAAEVHSGPSIFTLPNGDCPHRVTFQGKTLNGDGSTTWSYFVENLDGPGCGTSHWSLELCQPFAYDAFLDATPGGARTSKAGDPSTGIVGVKWNGIESGFTSGKFSVTLNGNFPEGSSIPLAIKLGAGVIAGTIQGPSCSPDLTITKDDSKDPILRTQFFAYQIVVSNTGPADASQVVVTDTLPKADVKGEPRLMTFVDAKGSDCSVTGPNQVECQVGVVVAGASVKITLNVRAPTVRVSRPLTNEACVSSPDEAPDLQGDNCAEERTDLVACLDIDGDGTVSISDILLVVMRFGEAEGGGGYDLLFDSNGDGIVGIEDVLHVVLQFGKTCVPA